MIAYINRSIILVKLHDWDAAMKDANMCLELDPTYCSGYKQKSIIHTKMKQQYEAFTAPNCGL